MTRLAANLAALLAVLAAPALAEPRVLADIAPVHSLVAQVMAGTGEPDLLLPQGEPPHDIALRPSEARAIADADVVIWTGPAMLPWMEDALLSLAPEARTLALLDTDGWTPRPACGDGGDDHDHDHGAVDPHAWLDPAVAAAWLGHIADTLAAADPDRAALYAANAAGAVERLRPQGEALRTRMAPHRGQGFAASHDALQYFERAADLASLGAAAAAHGGAAPAASLLALRVAAVDGRLSCLLMEPGADPALAAALGDGTALRVSAIDPEGLGLEPGPRLHTLILAGVADALDACLH